MTPKEKAHELVNKYMAIKWVSGSYKRDIQHVGISSYGRAKSSQRNMTKEAAKECAIVLVNEMRNVGSVNWDSELFKYWNAVSNEINIL